MKFASSLPLLAAAMSANSPVAAFADVAASPPTPASGSVPAAGASSSAPVPSATADRASKANQIPRQNGASSGTEQRGGAISGSAALNSNLQSLNAERLAQVNRPVTLVFANATTTQWIDTLSKSADVPLNLDPVLKMRTLAPLSVVANNAPFYPLLLQIATAEGLGITPVGGGFTLYQLSPTAKQQMGGLSDYVNVYGNQYGYNAQPMHTPTAPSPSVSEIQPPGAIGGVTGSNRQAPTAPTTSGMIGYGRYTRPRGVYPDAALSNNPAPAPNSGGYGGGRLPNGIPNSSSFGGGSGSMGGGGYAATPTGMAGNGSQPAAGGASVLNPAQSAPGEVETNDVGLSMADGPPSAYGAPYGGGYAPRSPLQNSSSPALQLLLSEVLEYAQTARRELVPPDRLHPEIQTSSGSLQYLAVVVEAFNHLPRVENTVGAPIAVARLRNLLSRAEAIHQRACHREELQTEILILRRRLPATADPAIHNLLTDILRRRENEMAPLGP